LALIRIPLWWNYKKEVKKSESCRETFEYRAPDAFANAYLLLAGLAVAANYGLENSKQALKIAEGLHVEAAGREPKKLKALPMSCSESAENLEKDRQFYEANGVFPRRLIDKTVEKLEAYGDQNLWNEISGKPEQIEKIIMEYLHYG
jgi:glutamine synthetase